MDDDYRQSTVNIMLLSFFLIALILLLVYLYKKLNQENNEEYTIRRMVLKEGGLRDQARVAAIALGTGLRVRLCPGRDSFEEGEEMQEIRDEEGQVEEGGSQWGDSEVGSQEEEGKGDNVSHATSSSEGLKAGEQTRLTDQPEAKVEGKREEEEEAASKGEETGGSGLLIDLKQFAGSAIWSEEKGMEREVTSL
ncbi:uncharacterized protein si:ch211-119e14.1 [Platichthys flesus]|uniref:uncharacterized protein si:ch211-119e14.1 n=1 Tax=Platichthys flesus TaxID=8260 RepID=UPI001A86DBB6|nr:uncharacterized protein si:ch211-119e14.1 [Platichthys flesus]XP_062240598.1 uncharacterized protein si:ch211-119e14.1 [Platichthys flesus]